MSPEAGWLLVDQIVPRLRGVIPRSVLCVGSEDHEELIQDATCMAARIMDNGEKHGKRVPHQSAAYYAIQHCKSGRRSVGYSNSDVHGSSTQLNGRSRLESMEEVVASNEEQGGEIFELHDVLGSDHEDVAQAVARKMDWEDFMAGLSERDQAVIECLIEGKSTSSMSRKLKVSDWSIKNSKKSLAVKIAEFMGADILLEVRKSPQWKQDLEATREKLACKHDRAH
jgi:DNA-directed RNA polymerase specialized sigma24 family protein